ncbi:flagellar hook-basal body complex protein [Consotaella salsifontis]|uniref:Flagellar hook protein FlgE n=1 Tax=Consotaella salsifontis TaxID=1365950 RepID=A0A1T4NS84_9HYPH|nr:flagellar hook-basal body complex protein [Consotaella salsifontis]SJZ82054.1 flagellar hook-basal body protein [Consotaella salsifontis]
MSIYGIMRSSVSGMNAQANRLSAVSDNIANSNTNGYKRSQTDFSSLVLNSGATGVYSSGVVETTTRNLISQQGSLSYTTSTTDLAISGNGFMVVSDAAGNPLLTRAGSFVKDSQGNLVNSAGLTLMGYKLPYGDTVGVANGYAGLEAVNLNTSSLIATPTTSGILSVNLPKSADMGGTAAKINAGVFDVSAANVGDRVSFDISLDGATAKKVTVVTTEDNLASPAAFENALQNALDGVFGTDQVVADVDSSTKAISFATGDKGSAASIKLENVGTANGDDIISSTLGLAPATSTVAATGNFASVKIGTFNSTGASIGDRVKYSIAVDGNAPVDVEIVLTKANTASAAAFKTALQTAVTAAGLGDVKVSVSGTDISLSLGTASNGTNNISVGLAAASALDGDGTTTSNLGLTAAAIVNGTDRVPPSANLATSTYTKKTSLVAYDSVGAPVTLDIYMTKTSDNVWEMAVYNRADADKGTGEFPYSSAALTTQTLSFDGDGKLSSAGNLTFVVPNGKEMTLDISSFTQLGADYTLLEGQTNGNSPSDVDKVEISSDGIVSAVFENGSTLKLYKIPMAMVESPENLQTISGNAFQATMASGAVTIGFGGEGSLGKLVSGAVELSTVDLASELTDMIEAQRGYTANSKAFQTGADILDVLVNLKR